MIVYLAARYSRREELNGYAGRLRAEGFTVDARWLLGAHQVSDDQLNWEAKVEDDERQDDEAIAFRQMCANDDWEDLARADVIVAFSEPPRSNASRGGRHVEFGIALALQKRVVVVGPRENVFHCLPQVAVVRTFDEALALLVPIEAPA